MAARIVNSGGIGIDTSDFRTVATALRKAGGQVPKSLRKSLRAAGEIVAVEAKAISSEHSTKIPGSIKVRVTSTTVSIVAGGPGVPTGGLFEEGNAGSSSGGTFRHPVFAPKGSHGDHTVPWVDQPMHQYLLPAAQHKEEELLVAITAALDEAVATISFV